VPLKGTTLSRPLSILRKECSLATDAKLFVLARENLLPVDHLRQPLPVLAQLLDLSHVVKRDSLLQFRIDPVEDHPLTWR
jgi:hypothetical protein